MNVITETWRHFVEPKIDKMMNPYLSSGVRSESDLLEVINEEISSMRKFNLRSYNYSGNEFSNPLWIKRPLDAPSYQITLHDTREGSTLEREGHQFLDYYPAPETFPWRLQYGDLQSPVQQNPSRKVRFSCPVASFCSDGRGSIENIKQETKLQDSGMSEGHNPFYRNFSETNINQGLHAARKSSFIGSVKTSESMQFASVGTKSLSTKQPARKTCKPKPILKKTQSDFELCHEDFCYEETGLPQNKNNWLTSIRFLEKRLVHDETQQEQEMEKEKIRGTSPMPRKTVKQEDKKQNQCKTKQGHITKQENTTQQCIQPRGPSQQQWTQPKGPSQQQCTQPRGLSQQQRTQPRGPNQLQRRSLSEQSFVANQKETCGRVTPTKSNLMSVHEKTQEVRSNKVSCPANILVQDSEKGALMSKRLISQTTKQLLKLNFRNERHETLHSSFLKSSTLSPSFMKSSTLSLSLVKNSADFHRNWNNEMESTNSSDLYRHALPSRRTARRHSNKVQSLTSLGNLRKRKSDTQQERSSPDKRPASKPMLSLQNQLESSKKKQVNFSEMKQMEGTIRPHMWFY